ncbi:hypothetical protein BDN72DRAFT_97708 [Pluteus cervinus]|uniref:Uncharacterized protein n=1 Tax=Pluteus cervinus TaxID=181527 RepID=A0ACD3APX3_9AGAR|nr:hypothetical protein BDN72DRAFT_97708 [Pluteus cervinus]
MTASQRAPHLPLDVLRQIIPLVLTPDYGQATNPWCFLLPRPQSRWYSNMITKKALIRVCKSWYTATLPFLYQDITLRRVGAIFALSKTLEDGAEGLGGLVQSISVICAVPRVCLNLVGKRMQVVLSACPSLKRLTYSYTFVEPIGFYPALCVPSAPNLTHLSLRGRIDYMNLPGILSRVSESLAHFSFQLGQFPVPTAIHFPRLETVVCSHMAIPYPLPTLEDIDKFWSMPVLKTIKIEFSEGWLDTSGSLPPSNLDILERFMQRHGSNVTALQFQSHLTTGDVDFRRLANYCPILERLYAPWRRWVEPLDHPNVKALFLWWSSDQYRNSVVPIGTFPDLELVFFVQGSILGEFPEYLDQLRLVGYKPDDPDQIPIKPNYKDPDICISRDLPAHFRSEKKWNGMLEETQDADYDILWIHYANLHLLDDRIQLEGDSDPDDGSYVPSSSESESDSDWSDGESDEVAGLGFCP